MIPYLDLQRIHTNIRKELDDVYYSIMNEQWFIHGKYNKIFEREFGKYCEVDNCIGVGNGLDAIRLILQGLDIGIGDEVIVPANTFIATVLAITYVGAIPVLVDADPETYNIDFTKIENKITEKTKAIIVVHLYGHVADVSRLAELKEKYHLAIIEDAAQAHGGMIGGKKVGNLGDVAAFSFYPGKNLGALGDAGAIVTADDTLAERIRAIANYGSKEKYVHLLKGCNSRLDELQAGFLGVKLKYLEVWNEERRMIAYKYNEEIHNTALKLPQWDGGKDHVFHIYPILCGERDKLIKYLNERGISTNIHYPIPIYKQKAYSEMESNEGEYPVTEAICNMEVSIPLYPGLTLEEQEYIVNCLNSFKQ